MTTMLPSPICFVGNATSPDNAATKVGQMLPDVSHSSASSAPPSSSKLIALEVKSVLRTAKAGSPSTGSRTWARPRPPVPPVPSTSLSLPQPATSTTAHIHQ